MYNNQSATRAKLCFAECQIKYHGQRDHKVLEFLKNVTEYKQLEGISDANALNSLDLLLMQDASKWWKKTRHHVKTWYEAVQRIRSEFIPPPHEVYTKLFIPQKSSESIDIFIVRERLLFVMLPTNRHTEEVQLDMIYGLIKPYLKQRVPRSEVKNFEELLEKLRRLESDQKIEELKDSLFAQSQTTMQQKRNITPQTASTHRMPDTNIEKRLPQQLPKPLQSLLQTIDTKSTTLQSQQSSEMHSKPKLSQPVPKKLQQQTTLKNQPIYQPLPKNTNAFETPTQPTKTKKPRCTFCRTRRHGMYMCRKRLAQLAFIQNSNMYKNIKMPELSKHAATSQTPSSSSVGNTGISFRDSPQFPPPFKMQKTSDFNRMEFRGAPWPPAAANVYSAFDFERDSQYVSSTTNRLSPTFIVNSLLESPMSPSSIADSMLDGFT